MSPSKPLRACRNRQACRSLLHLESLERRLPLAGNVTANLSGSTLVLTGDSLGNELLVASAAGGRIAVIGSNTTINGSTAAFVTTKAVTAIVANVTDGNDAIGFGNRAQDWADQRLFIDSLLAPSESAPPAPFDVAAMQTSIDSVAGGVTTFSIPGSLTVTTAGGDDSVGISGTIGGSVTVDVGSAAVCNGLVIGSKGSASRVGGSVTVVGGAENDIVLIGNVSVAGTVSAALGDGINWMIVGAATIGAFAYTGGVNTDIVGLSGDVTVRHDVRIFTGGGGEDEVGFYKSDAGGTVKVIGNVVVNTGTGNDGDTVALVGDFRGDVSVTTGGGRDTVSVSSLVGSISTAGGDPIPTFAPYGQSTIGRDLAINTGAGNDLISIGVATVGRNVSIGTGSGDDSVRIDGMQVGRNLSISLGAGNDSLTVTKLRAFAASFYGGSGTNSLTTGSATRNNYRVLRHYQFQALSNG